MGSHRAGLMTPPTSDITVDGVSSGLARRASKVKIAPGDRAPGETTPGDRVE
jgi:hypothetical protein